ncbi:MAG: hypothetical protein ABI867_15675 [Kofleriaceae bacterium]
MVRKLLATLLFTAACSAAQADQAQIVGPMPPGTAIAIGIADAKVRAPYDVQVIREGGDALPTYAAKDRFYVQGNAGERYIIKVTNPTATRVEAVVTVDGLDVIDGESGDLHKRGYVVPPYGEVRIEGFRTSSADVATFRFNSVDESYAGKKGKARNVGVIAVAIFEEQHAQPEQQIILGNADRKYDYRDDLGKDEEDAPVTASRGAADKTYERNVPKQAKKAPSDDGRGRVARRPVAEAPAAPTSVGGTGGGYRPPPPPHTLDDGDFGGESMEQPAPSPRTNRPGLGTEYGEQRYSAASFTRFVRGGDRPIAVAELRYNNAAGLFALGINAEPLPDSGEIMTRETADPFPGDSRYSQPPR